MLPFFLVPRHRRQFLLRLGPETIHHLLCLKKVQQFLLTQILLFYALPVTTSTLSPAAAVVAAAVAAAAAAEGALRARLWL